MSEPIFCYWSVADGPYAGMVQTAVRSARAAGVCEDSHVWSDREVVRAVTHDPGLYVKALYLFKLEFLRYQVARLRYAFFVFLDADTYFVRHPGNPLAALHGAPVHVLLESDCTRPGNRRPDWWGLPVAGLCGPDAPPGCAELVGLQHERRLLDRASRRHRPGC